MRGLMKRKRNGWGWNLLFKSTVTCQKEALRDPQSSYKPSHGVWKIQQSCAIAKANECEYMWIVTVCIDKTDNAEVSESINSMFAWYKQASVCYAYLIDVEWKPNEMEPVTLDGSKEQMVYQRMDAPRAACPARNGFLRPVMEPLSERKHI